MIILIFKQKQNMKKHDKGSQTQIAHINTHDDIDIVDILIQQNIELTMIVTDIMTSIQKIITPIKTGKTISKEDAEHISTVLLKGQRINCQNINRLKELREIQCMNDDDLYKYIDMYTDIGIDGKFVEKVHKNRRD